MVHKVNKLNQQGTSLQEIEVYNFIKMLLPNNKIIKNDRTVLNGREIDIYIPALKIGIEFNGLYFHSSNLKTDPYYHITKSIECEKKGIQLIQIMSDEWEQKKPLILDLIRRTVNKVDTVNLQNCKIVEIDKQEGNIFLNNHSINSYDKKSTLYYAVLLDNEKMAVASFKKGENNWILTRYAERKGYKVRDGLISIINEFRKEHKGPITSSVDRRLFKGIELREAGFNEVKPTGPNVMYTKDFKKRIPPENLKRFKESDLESRGYYKVFDCGNRRFLLN